MKKLAAVISTTLIMASASANAEVYLGAKAGATFLHSLCDSGTSGSCDEDSWALGAFLGYEINDTFALEAGFDALGDTTSGDLDDESLKAYTIAPRYTQELADDLDVFAKLGGAFVDYADEDDWALLGAIGLSYNLTKNIDLQAEYQHINYIDVDVREFNANSFTLGFRTKFGGSDEDTAEPVQEVMVEEAVEQPAEEPVAEPVSKKFEKISIDSGNFELNSAELNPEGQQEADRLAVLMNEHPEAKVELVGYTDSLGAASYNQKLSEKRAQAVADALTEQGVDSSRITVRGEGENNPIASNDTKEGRAKNRRVEILVPEFEYEVK